MEAITTLEDEKIREICRVVYSTLLGDVTRRQKEMSELGAVLAVYPPRLIDRMYTELTKVQDDLANELVIILTSDQNDLAAVDEYVTFSHYVSRTTTMNMARKMINSLHSYPQLPVMDNYAEASEQVQTQISALLHVADRLFQAFSTRLDNNYPLILDKGKVMLEGDSLIRLVITHPDKADLIATTIISRNIKDATLLRDVITSDAPSISEGTL